MELEEGRAFVFPPSPPPPLFFFFFFNRCCCCSFSEHGSTTSNASIGRRIDGPKRMRTVALARLFGEVDEAEEKEAEEAEKNEASASAFSLKPSTKKRALASARRAKWWRFSEVADDDEAPSSSRSRTAARARTGEGDCPRE